MKAPSNLPPGVTNADIEAQVEHDQPGDFVASVYFNETTKRESWAVLNTRTRQWHIPKHQKGQKGAEAWAKWLNKDAKLRARARR